MAAPLRSKIHPAIAIVAAFMLGACGLINGADDKENEATVAKSGPEHPDVAPFETVDMADAQERPQMRLQVVLDRLGFGPGVIDGKDGMSTANAIRGFQEANGLPVTGEFDAATAQVLARWGDVPATRVVRIPESWNEISFASLPDDPADQARLDRLGYETLDEKLAERFHTSIEALHALNPGGRPARAAQGAGRGNVGEGGESAAPGPDKASVAAAFRPGQLVRVPNVGLDGLSLFQGDNREWRYTLASLGISETQPDVAKIVVDESESWLKAYDAGGKLVAMFTVTSGSRHDPLPLGEWGINGISRNPTYVYNPAILRNAPDSDARQQLPPGPNSPVGAVWIDLTKEHYGIHGTSEPHTIGRAQSNGCVRLTNWDAARLAQMVSTSTVVLFQA